jgi:primosomal protein N' (replication factor Y)
VESELKELYPEISIVRMDADAVTRVNSHDKLLARFHESKAHILLGTQMITKGLDFENVTLVGVISADSSLYMSDFRAHERTFSMITQVIGRSGRGDKLGRAVIQTFTPEHEVLLFASKQDYDGFYEREISLRRSINCPPICDLIVITAVGLDEQVVIAACNWIRQFLGGCFSSDKKLRLLGPAPVPVIKVNNKYRYRLLVSCKNTRQVRDTVAHAMKEFMRSKSAKGVTVFADLE